jgi:hypothetical protein
LMLTPEFCQELVREEYDAGCGKFSWRIL